MFNVLYLYNSTQTYTGTVYEHIRSFAKHSRHRAFFCHLDQTTDFDVALSRFDAIAIHYSIRLPFDQLSLSSVEAITTFDGVKFLFIQDEYDYTRRSCYWIKRLGIHVVFTVVPERGVSHVYPSREFPGTRFVSVLTGYVPDELNTNPNAIAPSQRTLVVGYRGRPLPIRYGKLGMEKVEIGKIVKSYCDAHGIENDIAWSEKARIYGPGWHEFIGSCRSMLGSESGSNVFDWDGTLGARIAQFRKLNPQATGEDLYEKFVRAKEIDGIMNQVSPRVFEAIASRTVLVLFEGDYSGIVTAGTHYIPLKKDGSNLEEVVRLLQDGVYVDAMAERAYQDVILAGRCSYQSFVRLVDEEIERSHRALGHQTKESAACCANSANGFQPTPLTSSPIRAMPWRRPTLARWLANFIWSKVPEPVRRFSKPWLKRSAIFIWSKLPEAFRRILKPWVAQLLKKG